ncbi:hypothetical protein NDU88_005118 [Pleurodeles waltl]|uniref:Uncharacterized protein n=1 Tax=Pleurodeles waltl TaxID=8319 RepID=A0AAV7PH78_PLEWA|nr:hypothetical protein NDU88_005118 [Pleurodeles waltl]
MGYCAGAVELLTPDISVLSMKRWLLSHPDRRVGRKPTEAVRGVQSQWDAQQSALVSLSHKSRLCASRQHQQDAPVYSVSDAVSEKTDWCCEECGGRTKPFGKKKKEKISVQPGSAGGTYQSNGAAGKEQAEPGRRKSWAVQGKSHICMS